MAQPKGQGSAEVDGMTLSSRNLTLEKTESSVDSWLLQVVFLVVRLQ